MSYKLSTDNCDNIKLAHNVGKRTLILAVLHLPHSLLYVTFSCLYRTVCYLEDVSFWMEILWEETDFGDVIMLETSHRTSLLRDERMHA